MVKRKKNEQKQRQTRDEPGKTEIRESLYTEFSVERTHQPGPRFLFFIWCPVLYYSSMQTPHVGNHQQKKTIGAYQQPKPRPTWGATPRPARRAVSRSINQSCLEVGLETYEITRDASNHRSTVIVPGRFHPTNTCARPVLVKLCTRKFFEFLLYIGA